MSTEKKKEISLKNTKAVIFEAYQEALRKLHNKKTENPQESVAKKTQQKNVDTATELSPENIVKSVAALKINLSGTLDKVEDMFLTEFRKFSDLKDAIQTETDHLAEIYQIKAEADSLAVMLLAQKEKQEEFESEKNNQTALLQKQREDFQREMEEKRHAWEKEKAQRAEEAKEAAEQLKKARKREEEEYSYQVKISRKKEQDQYAEEKAKLEKELAEKRMAFENEFRNREEQILSREKEFAELKKKVDGFSSELEKAVGEAEKTLAEKLTKEFNHEKELLAKETEGLLNLKNQTIQMLEDKIKEQEIFVKQLNQKTESADRNAKEVALKAIESSKVQWPGPVEYPVKKPEEKK